LATTIVFLSMGLEMCISSNKLPWNKLSDSSFNSDSFVISSVATVVSVMRAKIVFPNDTTRKRMAIRKKIKNNVFI